MSGSEITFSTDKNFRYYYERNGLCCFWLPTYSSKNASRQTITSNTERD